jgi:hypothetical protein
MEYVKRLPYYEKATVFWTNMAKKYGFDLIRGIFNSAQKSKIQLFQ